MPGFHILTIVSPAILPGITSTDSPISVQAIIFLAPISCFNQSLLEDPRVNRLQDSFMLFETIIRSKLLSKATIVVFLNKIDVLKEKLKDNIMVKDYITNYGDRSNDVRTVVRCQCPFSFYPPPCSVVEWTADTVDRYAR
jgi:hypothetical protein